MKRFLQWFKSKPTEKENKIINILIGLACCFIVFGTAFIVCIYNTYYTHMQISCTDDFNVNEYIEEIKMLPDEVQKSFIVNMGSVSIEKEKFEDHEKETGRDSIGLYETGTDRIWLQKPDATLHEFGHYVHTHLNKDYKTRIEECYEKEGTQCFDSRQLSNNISRISNINNGTDMIVYLRDKEVLGHSEKVAGNSGKFYYYDYKIDDETFERDYPALGYYATVSYREYFADYFRYWLKNRNDTDEMQKLKDKTPDTYDLFIDLENDNWGMNKSIIDKILGKLVVIKYE